MNYYTRGLRENPINDGLFVARGIVQYGITGEAITDFEQAINRNTPLIWPYLFLAHHYLIEGQFERCRVMCERGLQRHGPDTAKSQLHEWRAIAQAEFEYPQTTVMIEFEAAVDLDPTNNSAKRNQAAFEESLRSGQKTIEKLPEMPENTGRYSDS